MPKSTHKTFLSFSFGTVSFNRINSTCSHIQIHIIERKLNGLIDCTELTAIILNFKSSGNKLAFSNSTKNKTIIIHSYTFYIRTHTIQNDKPISTLHYSMCIILLSKAIDLI